MTKKELNQAIKNEIRGAGYAAKDFTVSVRDGMYDTYIKVRIKNPEIRQTDVEALLGHWEDVDRDARTGEILGGCNTFVSIQYAAGVVEDAAAELLPTSELVLADPKYDGHRIADNGKHHVSICRDDNDNCWLLWEQDNAPGEYKYRPNYRVFDARDLAVAMWRFKCLGTIYA